MHRQDLQGRWKNQRRRIEEVVAALKTGKDPAVFLGSFESEGVFYETLPTVDAYTSGIIDLRGLPLENIDLTGARLEGLDLEFAVFFKMGLRGAVLSSQNKSSNLASATFIHCDLESAKFCSANCSNAHFGHCNLATADFSRAMLDGAVMRSSTFAGANFAGASVRDVEFLDSEMRDLRVSADTILGVSTVDGLMDRIPLQDQAASSTFDRFQFASQADAYKGASDVYRQLAKAWENSGLEEASDVWKRRERECIQLAQSGGRHG